MAGYSRHFLAFAEIDLEWGRCFFAGPRQCQAVERLKNVVGHNNESSAFVAPWKELLHGVVHSLALATINYAHCSYTMSIVYSKLDLGTMIAPLKGKQKDALINLSSILPQQIPNFWILPWQYCIANITLRRSGIWNFSVVFESQIRNPIFPQRDVCC